MTNRSRSRLEQALSTLLTIAVVAMAGVLVYREVFGTRAPAATAAGPRARPELLAGWEASLPHAITLGAPDAPVNIVEFTDFECPFCARFQPLVDSLLRENPGKLKVSVVHFPISGHRFARPAAKLAECAAASGHQWEVISALYRQRDSFGLKSWAVVAREAGIADTVSVNNCLKSNRAESRIDSGRAVGARLGVNATPTVLVNGWRLPRTPDREELSRVVRLVGENKVP